MIFGAIDPLKSRARFESRSVEILGVLAVVFLTLVILVSWISANVFSSFAMMLAGDVVAFGVCAVLYLQSHKRPLHIRCDGCRKIILSNTPWICGECGHQNLDTENFSLLQECANCHTAPKAYKCHHPPSDNLRPSDHLIFFSVDRDKKNVAKRLVSEAPRSKRRAKSVAEMVESHEDKKLQIETVKLDLVEAQLNERLETIKKRAVVESPSSDLDAKLTSLKKHMDTWTAVDEAARQQKARNAEDCKDVPKERKRRDTIVDDWVFRQKAEGQ